MRFNKWAVTSDITAVFLKDIVGKNHTCFSLADAFFSLYKSSQANYLQGLDFSVGYSHSMLFWAELQLGINEITEKRKQRLIS